MNQCVLANVKYNQVSVNHGHWCVILEEDLWTPILATVFTSNFPIETEFLTNPHVKPYQVVHVFARAKYVP